MNLKLIILLSLVSLSSLVHATDGEITFTGRVLDTTCTLGGTDGDYTVTLPTVGKTALSTTGATAGDTTFNIELTNCPISTGISAFFDNTITEVLSSGRLKNTATSGAAGNVDIELLNANGAPLKLHLGTANAQLSTKVENSTTGGGVTLGFKARYYATAPVTSGGEVASRAVYTIIYE